MKHLSFHCPFCLRPLLAALAVLALSMTAAVEPVHAQAAQRAALSETAKSESAKAENASPEAPAASKTEQNNVAAADQANPPPRKSLTDQAIDKVKQVAKSASDIFSRVPCLPPKGGVQSLGSLPRVANRLVAGQPVVIVAFGSSSTQGYGSSAPEFTYPNRLADQLKRKYPTANITVINAGVGGEDAPEM